MIEGPPDTGLRRALSFWALVIYGVGDILGAGIYALVGKIAGLAGTASWLAFLLALTAAAFTALSYAELGGRMPRSGGESQYCQTAFRSHAVGLLIGWLVLSSGIVSMATVSRAFAGYLGALVAEAPDWLGPLTVGIFLVVLSAVNFWGMRQSSTANIVCTAVEVSGLFLVIGAGLIYLSWGRPGPPQPPLEQAGPPPSLFLIVQAAALAFFAFIGFEDMVNVAEEVHSPRKVLPVAILVALAAAGAIYVLVVWIATHIVPASELAASDAPLLEVVRRAAPAFPPWLFTVIALFAVANTGLLNCIMGSRLLYGMAEQGLVPRPLSAIHPRTRTPHWSILVVLSIALILALSGTLIYLAGTTSVLLLIVFSVVNLALIQTKRSDIKHGGGFRVPLVIPVIGLALSVGLIYFLPARSRLLASVFLIAGFVLIAVWHSARRRRSF